MLDLLIRNLVAALSVLILLLLVLLLLGAWTHINISLITLYFIGVPGFSMVIALLILQHLVRKRSHREKEKTKLTPEDWVRLIKRKRDEFSK